MVRFGVSVALIFCFALLLIPTSAAESTDDPPIVVIQEIETSQTDDTYVAIFTGIYVDEQPPQTLTWKLFDGWDLIGQGSIHYITLDNQTLEATRSTWNWQFESTTTDELSNQYPCNCYLEVLATDNSGDVDTDWSIFYAGGFAEDPIDPAPLLIVEQDLSLNAVSGHISIEGLVLDRDNVSHVTHPPPSVQWMLTNSPQVDASCSTWTRVQGINFQWMNMTLDVLNVDSWTGAENGLNLSQYSATFSMTIDTSDIEDGSYQLVLRGVDSSGQSSAGFCRQISIDNTPPTAMISGLSSIDEALIGIEFDGSGSSDQYWGREDLFFLWVLEDEFGSKTIESGTDMRTFDMDTSQSGDYSLTLTVADGAGFSDTVVHQFNIANQEPVAALSIGGQPLTDGDSITLVDSDFWNIECGDSTDTANDQNGLTCTWHIDGEAVMTGWVRQLQKPEDLSKPHTLMLVVTDDDDANDTITVTFGVQGTPSDPMYSDDSLEWKMLLIFAAISLAIIIGGLFLYTRYNKHSTTIPKWKPE
ncbi:MAG: hypothetical protein QF454_04440 [Candidatus Thalassarchaeaceae archaeon]|nr:hypothetical protein [Candidatus Thalassarchaeaceae archaeon]